MGQPPKARDILLTCPGTGDGTIGIDLTIPEEEASLEAVELFLDEDENPLDPPIDVEEGELHYEFDLSQLEGIEGVHDIRVKASWKISRTDVCGDIDFGDGEGSQTA